MIPPSHVSRISCKIDRPTPRTLEEAFGPDGRLLKDWQEHNLAMDTCDKFVLWSCGILTAITLGLLVYGWLG